MHIHVTQHPNYLGNLQQSWDDCDYEFMTMITTTIRMFLHRLSTTISATTTTNSHDDHKNFVLIMLFPNPMNFSHGLGFF